jgi:hypothetical protein
MKAARLQYTISTYVFEARQKVARLKHSILHVRVCSATKGGTTEAKQFPPACLMRERRWRASSTPFSTYVFAARQKVARLKRTTFHGRVYGRISASERLNSAPVSPRQAVWAKR